MKPGSVRDAINRIEERLRDPEAVDRSIKNTDRLQEKGLDYADWCKDDERQDLQELSKEDLLLLNRYATELSRLLYSKCNPPLPVSAFHEDGVLNAIAHLSLTRDGAVRDATICRSSGQKEFDDLVEKSISPIKYPPISSKYSRSIVDVFVKFSSHD